MESNGCRVTLSTRAKLAGPGNSCSDFGPLSLRTGRKGVAVVMEISHLSSIFVSGITPTYSRFSLPFCASAAAVVLLCVRNTSETMIGTKRSGHSKKKGNSHENVHFAHESLFIIYSRSKERKLSLPPHGATPCSLYCFIFSCPPLFGFFSSPIDLSFLPTTSHCGLLLVCIHFCFLFCVCVIFFALPHHLRCLHTFVWRYQFRSRMIIDDCFQPALPSFLGGRF